MTGPRFTDLANGLPGHRALRRTRDAAAGSAVDLFAARLGANENIFGPSPRAIAAMEQSSTRSAWMYGDPENHDLQAGPGRSIMALRPTTSLWAKGSTGLLGYLVRLLIGPGDAVVTSDGAYPTFNFHVAGFGGLLHKVAYVRQSRRPSRSCSPRARDKWAQS
jgi:histidinol-phosphate aminotransferase